MKNFMDKDFLLSTDTAKKLFEIAKKQPIFDYHCHLSPKEIYENKQPSDIAALWLAGDHYKWRAMRSYGIDEKYITGDSTGYEKFKAWAETLPYCIGNPLYHWTHLELQRFFGIDTPLSPKTADEIWRCANAKIAAGGFAPRDLIKNSNVAALCTTDDPADSLEYHKLIAEDKSFDVKVLPAFRPDKALNIAAEGFDKWVEKLSAAAGIKVASFANLKAALTKRVEFFSSMGCVASDHAFVYVPFNPADDATIDGIFKKALTGGTLSTCEIEKYQTALMTHLSGEYHKHDIAMEFHLGAMRSNNTKMLKKLGPDTGFDSVNDYMIAEPLAKLMDSLEIKDILPKTILFTLNPKDNYVLGTMLGNFQSSETAGKIQLGTAWWVCDHIDGMRHQMIDLANLGVLGKFIGMLTDSRSFLSYPRHEYFRRILCDMLGEMVESGQYPADMDILSEIVAGISYKNAVAYFKKF
jgi:glucuronate isomerase